MAAHLDIVGSDAAAAAHVEAALREALSSSRLSWLLQDGICKLKWVESSEIPTACTDGVKVLYNPAFILRHSVLQASCILGDHEVGHVTLGHHLRGEGLEREPWLMSCEAALNATLAYSGEYARCGINTAGLVFPPQHLDTLASTAGAERLYREWFYPEWLRQQAESQESSEGQPGDSGEGEGQSEPQAGEGQGQPGELAEPGEAGESESSDSSEAGEPQPGGGSLPGVDDVRPAGSLSGLSPEQVRAMGEDWRTKSVGQEDTASALEREAYQAGEVKDLDVARAVELALHEARLGVAPGVDWREVLRDLVGRLRGDDWSWSRMARYGSGCGLPTLSAGLPEHICFLLDVSGSVSEASEAWAGQLQALLEDFGEVEGSVYLWGSRVTALGEFSEALRRLPGEIRSDATTRVAGAFAEALHDHPEASAVVVLTDCGITDTGALASLPLWSWWSGSVLWVCVSAANGWFDTANAALCLDASHGCGRLVKVRLSDLFSGGAV